MYKNSEKVKEEENNNPQTGFIMPASNYQKPKKPSKLQMLTKHLIKK